MNSKNINSYHDYFEKERVEDLKNSILLGASGSGKTHFLKKQIHHLLDQKEMEILVFTDESHKKEYNEITGSENKKSVFYIFSHEEMIEQIKTMKKITHCKDATINRYIIIDDASFLSERQITFLKNIFKEECFLNTKITISAIFYEDWLNTIFENISANIYFLSFKSEIGKIPETILSEEEKDHITRLNKKGINAMVKTENETCFLCNNYQGNTRKIYSIYRYMEPDKVLNLKFASSKREKSKTSKYEKKIPVLKNKGKMNVVGYLEQEYFLDYNNCNNDVLGMTLGNLGNVYLPIKEKKKTFHWTKGYIQVSETECVVIQQSSLFILWYLLLLIMLCLLINIGQKILPGNNEMEINGNVVNLDEVPEEIEEINMAQSMAYISGDSITTIRESYPNVYLKNEKENDKYTLVYEVYLEGEEEMLFKTGHIPAGTAEEWDAYSCGKLQYGENRIVYEVFIYDTEGHNVAQTTLNGLKIIKK